MAKRNGLKNILKKVLRMLSHNDCFEKAGASAFVDKLSADYAERLLFGC